jgi:hypothetical protein
MLTRACCTRALKPALIAAVAVLPVVAAAAEQKVVHLTGDRKITGQVTKTDSGYVIKTKYGTLTVAAEDVIAIKDVVTPEDEYQDLRAKMDLSKAEDRLKLGEWAMEHDMLEKAREEFQAALKIDPKYERARLRLRQVEAKIEARKKPTVGPDGTTRPAPPATLTGIRPEWLVSEGDIHHIRLEEMTGKYRGGVEFRNDVLKRFIEAMRGVEDFEQKGFEERFKGASRVDQARYMLRKLDRSSAMKDDIILKADPRFMLEFRRYVWPIVAQHCAAAQCHGGTQPVGGLKLFKIAGSSVKVDYTNFVLLDGIARGGRPVINRTTPDRSLLLEFGLPAEIAYYAHPKKITPPFKSREDRQYLRVLDWIRSLANYPSAPDYRLQYRPPFGMKLNSRASSALSAPEPTGPTTQPGAKGTGAGAGDDFFK